MWIFLTIIRLTIPFLIPKWPLWGMLIALGVDSFDFNMLPLHTASDYSTYQTWDKILDTYYLSFAVSTTRHWKDAIARNIGQASFFFRLIGVSLFTYTHARFLLIFFPNFFDIFFIFYLAYTKISHSVILFPTIDSVTPIVTALLLPKISQEFFIHGIQRLPAQFLTSTPPVNNPPMTISFLLIYLIQILAFLFPPALAMYWKIKQRQPLSFNIHA